MRRPKALPEIFSRNELKILFRVIDTPRMMIAVLLGYFGGLRISEVCNLTKADFELEKERPFMKIKDSKFGVGRNVPIISSQLIPILKQYFELIPSHYLMWSKKVNGAIDTATLWEEFRNYLERAGLLIPNIKDKLGRIRYKYHFHTLRHTIATHMIERGFNESYVQKFLGHKDLETVQIYTHISNPELFDKLNTMFDDGRKNRMRKQFFEQPEAMMEIEKIKLELERLKLENEKLRMSNLRSFNAGFG